MADKITPKAANIVEIFRQATVEELTAEVDWYVRAFNFAALINPDDPYAAAGVIAAVSPMTPWGRNQEIARKAFADGKTTGTLYRNAAKADRIMAGEAPLDVLSGKKVVNFYRSIIGDVDACCIDRHAFDIAVGRSTDDKTRQALARKGVYGEFVAAYVEAAEVISADLGRTVLASAVQSVSWVVWRRLKGLHWVD